MLQFKNIIIIVTLLLALGLTAEAQSTSRQPYEGAMHTYTCDGISVGAGYSFYITANADGSGLYDDGLTGEFEIINATGVVGGDGLASTPIQWNTGASAHIYYVWLEATISGGCSNTINIQITPQAHYLDLLSENTPDNTNVKSCPALAASDGFDPLATGYKAGTTKLDFRVKRENGTSDWSFIPLLTVNPDLVLLSNYIITITGANSGEIIHDGSNRYTVSGLDKEVIVSVSIENAPGNNREVKLQVTGQQESDTNLLDTDPSNDTATHTIEVMPVIGGMGGV